MWETITMTSREQARTMVLVRVEALAERPGAGGLMTCAPEGARAHEARGTIH